MQLNCIICIVIIVILLILGVNLCLVLQILFIDQFIDLDLLHNIFTSFGVTTHHVVRPIKVVAVLNSKYNI